MRDASAGDLDRNLTAESNTCCDHCEYETPIEDSGSEIEVDQCAFAVNGEEEDANHGQVISFSYLGPNARDVTEKLLFVNLQHPNQPEKREALNLHADVSKIYYKSPFSTRTLFYTYLCSHLTP
jgi:hypothetical protein